MNRSSASASASASALATPSAEADAIATGTLLYSSDPNYGGGATTYGSAAGSGATAAASGSKDEAPIDGISPEAFVADIKIGARLGGGHFGDVYSGTWQDCIAVALKRIKAEGDKGLDEFQAELAVLMQQRHPNIVTCYGVYRRDGHLYMVLERASEGGLDSVLKALSQRWQSDLLVVQRDLCAMARDAARGMMYLAEKCVNHAQRLSLSRDLTHLMDATAQ